MSKSSFKVLPGKIPSDRSVLTILAAAETKMPKSWEQEATANKISQCNRAVCDDDHIPQQEHGKDLVWWSLQEGICYPTMPWLHPKPPLTIYLCMCLRLWSWVFNLHIIYCRKSYTVYIFYHFLIVACLTINVANIVIHTVWGKQQTNTSNIHEYIQL